MDGNKKGMKGPLVLSAVLIVLSLVGLLVYGIKGTDIIMYYGIRLYRVLRFVLVALLGTGCVLGGISLGIRARRKGIEEKEQMRQEALSDEATREGRRRNARLSVEGELDAAAVRGMLIDQSRGRWAGAYELIYSCVEQMEQMDSYQARLKTLLMNNGAETLSDTEDVLNQVEQYICKNVRSVLNFMDVADDDAFAQVKEKLVTCREENQKLLEKTRDFIYALAEFLNDQGGKTDLRLLETYRSTILSAIDQQH